MITVTIPERQFDASLEGAAAIIQHRDIQDMRWGGVWHFLAAFENAGMAEHYLTNRKPVDGYEYRICERGK